MEKQTLFRLTFPLLVFFALNIPSLKLVYSTDWINIILFITIWLVGLIRVVILDKMEFSLSKIKKDFLIAFSLMWLIIFVVTLINSPSTFILKDFFKYFTVIFFVIGITLFIKKQDIPFILYFQVFWAASLSLVELTVGVQLIRELGQHYLTLGMPIAAGIICGIGLIFFKNKDMRYDLILVCTLIISILAVTSLKGRTPVLLSFLVPAIITIIVIILENDFAMKVKLIVIAVILLFSVGWFFYNNLSPAWVERFTRIANFKESEPRYDVYKLSFDLIKNAPLGMGLKGTVDYGLNYPHNMILEIIISGGVFTLIFFIKLLFIVIKTGIKAIEVKSYAIITLSLALFFFLTWNISYSLVSSYIPFVAMSLLICVVETNEN